MKRKAMLILLMALSVLLSGCGSAIPRSPQSFVTLPPMDSKYPAPENGTAPEYAETVLLCLPAQSDGQLVMLPERILLPQDQHPGETVLKKLFSFQGNERAKALYPEAQLQLQPNGFEISGDVATVNLGAAAGLLKGPELFTLRRAIANTLTQWQDIRYVNVLVDGKEPGMSAKSPLPIGSLQQTRNEDAPALWDSLSARAAQRDPEGQRFSSLCTLYFPAPSGRGVLAEVRTVSFRGQRPDQLALGLLEALSAGSQAQPQLPRVPDLVALLAEQPDLITEENGNGVLRLHLLQIANEVFIEAGIPRSVMLASLSFTLSTFIPRLKGLCVQIGNEVIEAIVPSGIYEGAGEQILFSDGQLRRADFASFLLTECSLYFATPEGQLVKVIRPVPYQLAFSKHYLIAQLMEGPQLYDSRQGLQPIFPPGITTDDLIAAGQDKSTALINFSSNTAQQTKSLSPMREKLLIYGLVNTLCDSRGVSRVRLYIEGEQPEALAGAVYLPGEFMRNPDIMRP